MHFELGDEDRQVLQLVERFVAEELLPLEPGVLQTEASGGEALLGRDAVAVLDGRARNLGLWGLDAPAELGGAGLSHLTVAAVNIAMGRTVTPYSFPPDSPNLQMLLETATEAQRERYLAPYVRGETISAIGISEPGAGSDPRGMRTRARRVPEGWLISGAKTWISKADKADFTIVMALTSPPGAERPAMSAFIVDADVKGMTVSEPIRMIGGTQTFEVHFDDVLVPEDAMLGAEGQGFAPMQTRLATRRLEIACWCIGMAERALSMMIGHVKERQTFGQPLSERQMVQSWIAEAAIGIRTCRLLALEIGWRLDQGEDVSTLVSMVKLQATDMATRVVDDAMQAFGAMGMSKEMPLHLMAARIRLMRIYDGPSEVHRWVVARNVLKSA